MYLDYTYGLEKIYSKADIEKAKFGIVATQLVDGKIQVIHAEEYERPNFTDTINVVWQLKQQYGNVTNIYVDAANPEVWQALKKEFGEPYNNNISMTKE